MPRLKPISIRDLMRLSGLDLEEVLLSVWDIGYVEVLSEDDVVPARYSRAARDAVGLATGRELTSLEYWSAVFGIDGSDLLALLRKLGFEASSVISSVPDGAVSRLVAEARRRGIDPLTGVVRKPRSPRVDKGRPPEQPVDEPRKKRTVYDFTPRGHENSEPKWLDDNDVIKIHNALVQDFADSGDPIDPPGVRSQSLLASAVFRPKTSLGGQLKYTTIESQAAALLHSIIHDHPFHNGNKRTALVCMLVVLDLNGVLPTCRENELFKLVLQVARHRLIDFRDSTLADREVAAINAWVCAYSRLIDKEEHPIPWRRVKGIMRSYGCRMSTPKVGNRLDIERTVHGKLLFVPRSRVLRTQVHYTDDGRDASIETIKKIREDLALDESNGIDSRTFYDSVAGQPEEFINRYRKTLDRLARL